MRGASCTRGVVRRTSNETAGTPSVVRSRLKTMRQAPRRMRAALARPVEQRRGGGGALAVAEAIGDVAALQVRLQRRGHPAVGLRRDRGGEPPAARVGVGLAQQILERRAVRRQADGRRVDEQLVERRLALPERAMIAQAGQRVRRRRGALVAVGVHHLARHRVGVLAAGAERARAFVRPAPAVPPPEHAVVRPAAHARLDPVGLGVQAVHTSVLGIRGAASRDARDKGLELGAQRPEPIS